MHEGVFRLRCNADGTRRSYDHHPLEVALIFATLEVFERRHGDIAPKKMAEHIVDVVGRISRMNKGELVNRLTKLSPQLTPEAFTKVVGLLCHDTIELSYDKNASYRIKLDMTRRRLRYIKALCRGAEDIVACLTDSKHHAYDKKRVHQLKLARRRDYASHKLYDVLANMYDVALIPNDGRPLDKKRSALFHMRRIVQIAYRSRHIKPPYRMAATLIYRQVCSSLG